MISFINFYRKFKIKQALLEKISYFINFSAQITAISPSGRHVASLITIPDGKDKKQYIRVNCFLFNIFFRFLTMKHIRKVHFLI